MAELKTIGAGLDPDDLWRNLFWLRGRVEQLEATCRRLEAEAVADRIQRTWAVPVLAPPAIPEID